MGLQVMDESLVPNSVDDIDQLERCIELFETEMTRIKAAVAEMQTAKGESTISHVSTIAKMQALVHINPDETHEEAATVGPSSFNIRVKSSVQQEFEEDKSSPKPSHLILPDYHPAMKQVRSPIKSGVKDKRVDLGPGNVDIRGFISNQPVAQRRKQYDSASSDEDSSEDDAIIDRTLLKSNSQKLLAKIAAGPPKKKKKKKITATRGTASSRTQTFRAHTPDISSQNDYVSSSSSSDS